MRPPVISQVFSHAGWGKISHLCKGIRKGTYASQAVGPSDIQGQLFSFVRILKKLRPNCLMSLLLSVHSPCDSLVTRTFCKEGGLDVILIVGTFFHPFAYFTYFNTDPVLGFGVVAGYVIHILSWVPTLEF